MAESKGPIGPRGLHLPPLGFGAAPVGNLYTAVSEDAAQAAIHAGLECGLCYFDTAPYYGHGLSEARLGRALAGLARKTFIVSTKVGRRILHDGARSERVIDGFAVSGTRAVFDYSRDGVQRSFEESLRRLELDRVDILLLHDIGRVVHGDRHEEVLRQALDEALPAMAQLRAAGVVDAIGIGVNEEAVCLEVMSRFDLDCVMLAGRYTLLEQEHSTELRARARQQGVAVLAAAPYNSGLLSSSNGPGATYNYGPADAATVERARRIYVECAAEEVDVGAAALQFPLAHPAVACVVVGLRSVAEVTAAVDRMQARIPAALWNRLKGNGLLSESELVPGT